MMEVERGKEREDKARTRSDLGRPPTGYGPFPKRGPMRNSTRKQSEKNFLTRTEHN